MTENNTQKDELSAFDEFGTAFDITGDPLLEFDHSFKNIDEDPIEIYIEYHIENQDLGDSRLTAKKTILSRWCEHMEDYDRHSVCANAQHVGEYIDKEILKENGSRYIKAQLQIISNLFEYLSSHSKMPHGTGEAKGFNPVDTAQAFKMKEIEKHDSKKKPQHQITVEELSHKVRDIKNILHRAVIVTQLKYGLRGGQVSNIYISDLNIEHEELNKLYPKLGTHPRLDGFEGDVIYFVPNSEREGGKSKRPIVMPIDRELRRLLVNYLRQRPPIDDPHLFLNNSNGKPLYTRWINKRIWKPNFHPDYDETEAYDSVTSHYARHRFGTYWSKEIDANFELIKYMRGDKQSTLKNRSSDVLDNYVHTYYADIEDLYLNNIYKFNI